MLQGVALVSLAVIFAFQMLCECFLIFNVEHGTGPHSLEQRFFMVNMRCSQQKKNKDLFAQMD